MAVETTIDPVKNLILYQVSENVSLQVIIKAIENTLAHKDYRSGMDSIWHFEDDIDVNLTSKDLMHVAEFARMTIDEHGVNYKLALVAGDDLPYGMTRIYEAWSNDRPVTISNFRKLDDAYEWIAHS